MKDIYKIGMVVIENNKLLLVRKRGVDQLLMPGGKLEKGESAKDCLMREVQEELNVEAKNLKPLDRFMDISAEDRDIVIYMELYGGEVNGVLTAQNEIEEYVWFGPEDDGQRLSPIIRNKILPYLKAKGMFAS